MRKSLKKAFVRRVKKILEFGLGNLRLLSTILATRKQCFLNVCHINSKTFLNFKHKERVENGVYGNNF